MTTPILRWAGSKKKLLPILEAATPKKFTRYIEPFVGSAILYLQLPRNTPAILGDINPDLINMYETLRLHPRAVWNRLSKMPTEPYFYYELRDTNNQHLSDIEKAAKFLYLNRFCFNGVYRTNKDGKFNVARGKGGLKIPEWSVIKEFVSSIKNVDLFSGDFEKILLKAKRGSFIYLDPPYANDSLRDRGEYGVGSFKEFDIERLVNAMRIADSKGAHVLLSYSNHASILTQLKDWEIKKLSVFRNVAGFSGHRRHADEVLISNYCWK